MTIEHPGHAGREGKPGRQEAAKEHSVGWVKIEDRYARHPKILAAGAEAMALDIAGMCYAREHDTGGYIPADALAFLGPFKNARRTLGALLAVERWDEDLERGGWWIHDFEEYNPSSDPAAEARSERARKAANARWKPPPDDAPGNAQASMLDDADSNANGSMLGMPPSLPLPKNNSLEHEFNSLWELYPRKESRVVALKAYQARRKAGIGYDDLERAVGNFAIAMKGRDQEHILQGSTFFGPHERWKDYLEAPPGKGRNPNDFDDFSYGE